MTREIKPDDEPLLMRALDENKNEEIFRITMKGQVVVNPAFTPDEATKAFWDLMKKHQIDYGLCPVCATCGWWEAKEQYGIKGGLCHSKKMMQGYYLLKLNFLRDCITFAIENQTASLYYTGDLYGCVHHKLGTRLWMDSDADSGGEKLTKKEEKKIVKEYQGKTKKDHPWKAYKEEMNSKGKEEHPEPEDREDTVIISNKGLSNG